MYHHAYGKIISKPFGGVPHFFWTDPGQGFSKLIWPSLCNLSTAEVGNHLLNWLHGRPIPQQGAYLRWGSIKGEFTWAVFYEGTNADRSFFFISNLWSPYRSSHGPTVAIAYGKAAVHKSCLWHRSREYCTPTHVMAIRKPDTKEHRSNGCHRKLQSLAGLVSLGFLALHVGPEYLYPLFPVGPGYLPIYRSI